VSFHDPHVAILREDGHEMHGIPLSATELAAADAVVIVTDHRAVDYQFVIDHARLVIDSRNVTAGLEPAAARVVRLSGTVSEPLGKAMAAASAGR
jgi:UDP-N-acetyl-D-glucosamine dehydrogenase